MRCGGDKIHSAGAPGKQMWEKGVTSDLRGWSGGPRGGVKNDVAVRNGEKMFSGNKQYVLWLGRSRRYIQGCRGKEGI